MDYHFQGHVHGSFRVAHPPKVRDLVQDGVDARSYSDMSGVDLGVLLLFCFLLDAEYRICV